MLIESRSKRSPHLPAEVRAWCDGERDGKRCEEVGPPVEARAMKNKRDHDYGAGSLAVKVSGFFLRFVPNGRRTWTEEVYCRTCALSLLRKLEREHAAEIAAAPHMGAVMMLRWNARDRVEEMQKLRGDEGERVRYNGTWMRLPPGVRRVPWAFFDYGTERPTVVALKVPGDASRADLQRIVEAREAST